MKKKQKKLENMRVMYTTQASACVLLWEATLRAQNSRCVE